MEYRTLEVERDGPVVRVWLARPEKRNALNRTALEEIEALFTGLQTDFAARVVVLGGRGPSFCGGADRSDPPARPDAGAGDRERRWLAQLGLRACRAVESLEAITLARVHGHAVGGGFALALACDFRIGAGDCSLSVPEVDLGIPLSWGATPRLIQEVGAARAREIVLMCDRVEAARAEAWGLLHRVVPAAALDDEVERWARRIAEKPEVAVHMTKTQFRAYAHTAWLGAVPETDGDVLLGAARGAAARAAFRDRG